MDAPEPVVSSAEELFVNCILLSAEDDLICNKEAGLSVPIPTLLFVASTTKVDVSTVSPAGKATFVVSGINLVISEAVNIFCASSEAKIVFAAIFALVIALSAIFAVVTFESNIFAVVTASLANWSAVTCASSICFVRILFCAISVEPTAFVAMAAELTAFAPTSVVVVTWPITTSMLSVPLGGAASKVRVVPLTEYVDFG